MSDFNGLSLHMGNLSQLSNAKTRSISPENLSGEKGSGGMATDGPAKQCARDLRVPFKRYDGEKTGDVFRFRTISLQSHFGIKLYRLRLFRNYRTGIIWKPDNKEEMFPKPHFIFQNS